MPGIFYTLQEVIEKLGKTEAEIKTLVREGKLREFRDGTKQLYKTEDVEALAATPKGDTAILNDSLQIAIDETGEISLAPEELDALMSDKQESKSQFKLDETGELLADETLGDTKPQDAAKTKSGSEIPLAPAEPAKEEPAPAGEITTIFGESKEEKITNGDTKISLDADSISVLSESDTEFKVSEDTSGETKVVKGKQKALDEKGTGEARLDEDVNLESFGGSGSGLLDLSLQADDTSLGAVLDDIYPESPAAPAEQTPTAPSAAVAQEAEKIFEQAEPDVTTQPAVTEAAIEAAMVAVITEPPPDAASNAFGLALFVPLVVFVYTAIVVTSGYKPIINLKILSSLEPIIWYVAAGAAAVVILIALIGSFMPAGGNKPPKPPKTKQPKPVKEKKVKKEKKAKKEKETPPAKEQ